ncbi:MAG: leucine-rich repeat protein [Lachnospiraceae bacterium]|nr:leucine-rich repeat protein [Lachnospiraceae bacterium]
MVKQGFDLKPVKALIVALLTSLILVLLPKFGIMTQAATEITSGITTWSGEMTLTTGTVTISERVQLYNDTLLTVGTGCILTLQEGIEGNDFTLTVTGTGTVTVFSTSETTVEGNIVLNGGTLNIIGHNTTSEAGEGGNAIYGNIKLNGGTLCATGGNASENGEGGTAIDGNIELNGGTLYATGGNGAGTGAGGVAVNGNITLNGGALYATGGNGAGGYAINTSSLAIFNGGILSVTSGTGCNDGLSGLFRDSYINGSISDNKFYRINDSITLGHGMFYYGHLLGINISNQLTFTPLPTYTVSTTAGTGMIATVGASKVVIAGSGDSVRIKYLADRGYYFPSDYSVASQNGVSVTRDSPFWITVSGTPTADTTITLPAATPQTSFTVPQAVFTATGANRGVLSGLTAGARYAVTGATATTFTASGETQTLENVSPGTLSLVQKGNGEDRTDSPAQTLTVDRKATPALVGINPDRIGGKGSIPTTADHEYSTDGLSWTGCTGELTDLEVNTYYIRVKASEIYLASEAQTININRFNPQTEATPNATFTATDEDCGKIEGLIAGATYVLSGAGLSDYDITAETGGTCTIASGMRAGTLKVVKKGNNITTVSSAALSIPIFKPAAPNTTRATACSVRTDDNGKLSGITNEMEYKRSDDSNWIPGTGADITGLIAGTYYVRYKAVGTSLASEMQVVVIEAHIEQISVIMTPVNNPEPAKEEVKPITFTEKNKNGSVTTITIIRNEDGTVTTKTENKNPDGSTETKSETRDAKGNGTLSKTKTDADGNILSKTEGTIKVNKKGTETIKSVTENSDGSKEEKTQKTYKRDADNIKKVTVDTGKTDAEGNQEGIKMTAFVDGLGAATITEDCMFTFSKPTENTSDGKRNEEAKNGASGAENVVKEERQYSLSVNGRLKLLSLTSDGEKFTTPENIELDGMVRVLRAIGKNALKGNKTIKQVVIGPGVTTICAGAFKNCTNLELIELTGSVKKIYKNAFKGIAENARFVIEASEDDFARIVELIKASGVSDTVTFDRKSDKSDRE